MKWGLALIRPIRDLSWHPHELSRGNDGAGGKRGKPNSMVSQEAFPSVRLEIAGAIPTFPPERRLVPLIFSRSALRKLLFRARRSRR